jgi:hypothetical protein
MKYLCELINNYENMNYKVNKISQIMVGVILIAGFAGISSCEKYTFTPPKISTVDTVHFTADIQPIFNASCVSCHTATKAPDLRAGKSYAALTKGGYITPANETCELYTKMTGADHSPRSSDVDKQKVLVWLTQGAKNN